MARYGESTPLRVLQVTVYFGQIDRMTAMNTTDAHFKKIQGPNRWYCPRGSNNLVSFESIKAPGPLPHLLRHHGPNTRVELASGLLDPWFEEESTFCQRNASVAGWKVVEFESVKHPGYFLRKTGDHLTLSRWDSSMPYDKGFVEMNPVSLGVPSWGGWIVRADGSSYIERWGECTGLTPYLGAPRWKSIYVVFSTERVFANAAVSTSTIGFMPGITLNGHGRDLGEVYSVERGFWPCAGWPFGDANQVKVLAGLLGDPHRM
jgi:hypothetical protein